MILDSNINSKKPIQKNAEPPETPYNVPLNETSEPLKQKLPNYTQGNQIEAAKFMRVGYPDQQTPYFSSSGDDLDYNLMKVVGHPRFGEVVKNYVLINHPEWLLKESVYTPAKQQNISYFGNTYQSTVCSNVKNYVIFFIVCMFLFLLLSMYFKQ